VPRRPSMLDDMHEQIRTWVAEAPGVTATEILQRLRAMHPGVRRRPALDAREQPFDSRTIERNRMRHALNGVRHMLAHTDRVQDRLQVFGAGQNGEVDSSPSQ
jgi:hypothetical protein